MITRDEQSYRVLANICMAGESSEEAIGILLPQDNYRQKLLYKLLAEKYITKYVRDDVAGYRLAKKGKELLLMIDKERFGFFLLDGADFSMHRPMLSPRLRQHRISETLAMMERETLIYRDRKKLIFEENPEQTEAIQQSAFFVAREVKAQRDLTRKIVGSKTTGVWVEDDTSWICYNMADTLPDWHENLENRTEELIRLMLQKEGIEQSNALLFGTDMNLAAKVLADGKMLAYLMNTTYERLCFIPLDDRGMTLLEMLRETDIYDDLYYVLTQDYKKRTEEDPLEHDGYNADGQPVLVCVDCDLKRLVQFINRLEFLGRTGEVICFDFQKEVLEEYCGKEAKVAAVDFKAFREGFMCE